MDRYESISVGTSAQLSHKITESDVEMFVKLTGDRNKIHIDKEFAKNTSVKKPVIHGMLGSSFISTVIGTKLPGNGAMWYSQTLNYLRPVRVGDDITVRVEVLKKHNSQRSIELKTEIFNQNRQLVTEGTTKVKILDVCEKREIMVKDKRRKNALVIGGSGGIGGAACLKLAEDGFNVAVHCCGNEERAAEVCESVKRMGRLGIVVKCDILDRNSVDEMVNSVNMEFDGLLVLVNAATVNVPAMSFKMMEWKDVQDHLDINIRGTFNLMKSVLPIMEHAGYGKVINISSILTDSIDVNMCHYITAKSALSGMTKTLAKEYAASGIRINLVSPGITDTELIADIPERIRLLTAAKTPLKRLGETQDVANAIGYLASENSDYITGETIRVNGGQVML